MVAEKPCWLCNHPQREAIEEHYRDYDHHVGHTAERFGITSIALRQHLPHFKSSLKSKRDSAAQLRKRVMRRAKTLHDYMVQAMTEIPPTILNGAVVDSGRKADLKSAAAIAEVMRRYDEMFLKLHQAPGFKNDPKGTTNNRIDAPGAKFLITHAAETAALDAEPDSAS